MAVRVHGHAQATLLRAATDGVELFLRHGRIAAGADALGCEDLDHVRSEVRGMIDLLPQIVDGQLLVVQRLDGRQDARAGQCAAVDGIADRLVHRSAERLHGGDPAEECPVRVLGRIERTIRRALVAIRFVVMRAAVGVEMPGDVHMRVDPARHERGVHEVDVGPARVLVDGDDLPVVDHHRGIAEQPAAAVDDARGADDHRRGGEGAGEGQGEGGGEGTHRAEV
jgi:hypothetical protein